ARPFGLAATARASVIGTRGARRFAPRLGGAAVQLVVTQIVRSSTVVAIARDVTRLRSLRRLRQRGTGGWSGSRRWIASGVVRCSRETQACRGQRRLQR